jgi:acetyl esterase/lipase
VSEFHPDLARLARVLPRRLVGPQTAKLMRALDGLRRPPPVSGVAVTAITTPTRLRIYRPENLTGPVAGLVWIHGGGMVIGGARQDERFASAMARDLGIVVASVDYRLAPEHPYPAPLDDCYAGLQWLHDQPDVDPARIAVGGASAGGGLAASLAQLAHDRGKLPVAFQLLIYPMLDDRSATRLGVDGHHFRLWTQKSNVFGWRAYLGQEPGSDTVTAPASPARRASLDGLPPAWIGVGSHDLFHDEDVEYAERLQAAGVPCRLEVVDGAFHGFDIVAARTSVAKAFQASWSAALTAGLAPAA